MSALRVALMGLVLIAGARTACAESRIWKSSDGKHEIDAEFVEATETLVRLKKPDGTLITVPLARLSAQDREFVASKSAPATPVGPPKEVSEEDADAATAELKKLGVRVLSSGLSLESERELSDLLREVPRHRKEFTLASREVTKMSEKSEQAAKVRTSLTQKYVQLNSQLTRVPANNVALHNQVLAAINANQAQLELMDQGMQKLDVELKAARGKANDAREAYVGKILDLRKMADKISTTYQHLAVKQEAVAALGRYNAASGKSHELTESTAFRSLQRKIKSLEDTVLSETIALRDDGSGTFYISTVIDGDHVVEMVVDSGASVISLPSLVAAKCGITPSSDDPDVILVLADGSEIKAKLVHIDSVRVGKFTLENVEAAVLEPRATNATPLLGMSFLQEFKFELDAQNSRLTMLKVE